jgi:hypothetical protein
MQGIYNYIPETKHFSRAYNSVAAVLYLQVMLHITLFHLYICFVLVHFHFPQYVCIAQCGSICSLLKCNCSSYHCWTVTSRISGTCPFRIPAGTLTIMSDVFVVLFCLSKKYLGYCQDYGTIDSFRTPWSSLFLNILTVYASHPVTRAS